ncbi:hypothetical protein SLEP1_g26829 [Rubroshorea leprosula]|uniref:Uncharacterized protein n=1 Tax=Rubroshorea leprosula TaxID=152421 RepID=A0AAV5JXP5_9ROSI|nr:hypothetical protein SLEP1_g26829 [Rubroshorea leprosula]
MKAQVHGPDFCKKDQHRGGPNALQIRETDLKSPKPGSKRPGD